MQYASKFQLTEITIYLFLSISLNKVTISVLTKHTTCISDKIIISVLTIHATWFKFQKFKFYSN